MKPGPDPNEPAEEWLARMLDLESPEFPHPEAAPERKPEESDEDFVARLDERAMRYMVHTALWSKDPAERNRFALELAQIVCSREFVPIVVRKWISYVIGLAVLQGHLPNLIGLRGGRPANYEANHQRMHRMARHLLSLEDENPRQRRDLLIESVAKHVSCSFDLAKKLMGSSDFKAILKWHRGEKERKAKIQGK